MPSERVGRTLVFALSLRMATKDPSVTLARQTAAAAAVGLEEYNPFTNSKQAATASKPPAAAPAVPTQPAVVKHGEEAPVSLQPRAQESTGGAGELLKRQEELEKKAAELDRREREMQSLSASGGRRNNWPPLPEKFPVGPCFYHDITVDIPVEYQKTVKIMYYLWMFHTGTLLANLAGSLAWFGVDSSRGVDFGLAVLWFLLFTPCSFVCWYRPVYGAFKSAAGPPSLTFLRHVAIFDLFFLFRLDLGADVPEHQRGRGRVDDPGGGAVHRAGRHVAGHVQEGARHVPHHRRQLPEGPTGAGHGRHVQQDGAGGRRLRGGAGSLQGAHLSGRIALARSVVIGRKRASALSACLDFSPRLLFKTTSFLTLMRMLGPH
ncbi:secretory carrier-associated membrane protein 1 isoform X1 [Hippocampus comes]|uniref:secretory carrier-associated membrane protein 1 isoform X1 n=1 Tax=Hippocampus comes TaxID=109280 RepID=UPI00094E90C6|nr:PREDICTED: secretory carrier-associated membrane protein 1 isoform X1 [Hippocampus comes]